MMLHFLERAAERAKGTLARVLARSTQTLARGPVAVGAWRRTAVLQGISLACALLFATGATLLTTDVDAASVCAAPGRDTIPTSGIVNSYWGGASATNGGTNATITLGNQRTGTSNTPYGTSAIPSTGISAGDLLVVMQMQGANAGAYEYVTVVSPAGPVTSGSVTVRGTGSNGGLVHSYTQSYSSGSTFQVIRVPQTLNASLGNYSVPTWDIDASGYGTGGVFALDVAQQATLNGTINVVGQGFRGGAGFNLGGHTTGLTSSSIAYASESSTGGSKGEGTQGTPGFVFDGYSATIKEYGPNGLTSAAYSNATPTGGNDDGNYGGKSFGFGALGNAGGGGNDADPGSNAGNNQFNSGGAGGGSAGRGGQGGWTWLGNAAYCQPVGFTPTACPFNINLQEGITDAGGRGGNAIGGLSAGMVVLGGGGGAASVNNNPDADTITTYPPIDVAVDPTSLSGGSKTVSNGAGGPISGSGARGGGIVLIRAGTFNAGAGQILADGVRAYNQFGSSASEAAGGGGGGGAIVVLAQAASGTLQVSATGGRGGDPDYYAHGPGGGGGGGFVLTNFSVSGSVSEGGGGYVPNINTATGFTLPNHYGTDSVPGVVGYLSSAGGTTPGTSSGAACIPDVAATVTLPTTGAVGATINGSFNYVDNGPSDAVGVGTGATLTAGLGTVTFGTITLNSVAVAGASATYNNSTGAITYTGLPSTIPNGQSLVVPISFTMPANGTSVTGTDSVSEAGTDPVPSNNNGTATVNGTPQADDAVTITGLPASAAPNAAIFGVLNFVNNGPSTSNGVTYTSKLPVGAAVSSIKYNGTTLAGASATVGADGTVTFTGLPATLNNGDTVTVAFNATMPANGSSAAATATIASTTTDSNTSNNTASAVVTGQGTADLATTITGVPTSAQAAGSMFTGTVNFQNNGPSTAVTPVYTVQVPPGSTITASQVQYNGTPINGVTVTIDQYGNVTFGGTGLPTSLANGDKVTVGFTATMPSDGSNANVVSSISSPTTDPNTGNNNATATVTGIREADLQSTVTGYATFAQTAGTSETGTITFANNGPSGATGVTYTSSLSGTPTGVTLGTPMLNGVAISGATATYNTGSGTVTYTGLPTSLNSGDKVTVGATFTMPGNPVTVSSNITSNTTDPVPSNNAGSQTLAGGNDLAVAISGLPTGAQTSGTAESEVVTYSIVNGSAAAPANYTPVLTLTPGLTVTSITATNGVTGTYNATTGAVTFTGLPTLSTGGTNNFAVTVNYTMPASNVVTQASISESPNIDTYSPNNSATATVSGSEAMTDIATTITGLGGVAAAGATVSTGVIHFTNAATNPATSTSFAAKLPVGASVTSITLNGTAIAGATATVGSDGTVTFSGLPTSMAKSDAIAVAFSFPMPSDGSNAVATATVTSSNDSNTANNTASATETGDAATDLQTKVTQPTAAAPNATLNGTVDYLDNGPGKAINPTYQLTLPVAGGTPSVTSVMLNGSLLQVTATVAANGVVTFTGMPTTLTAGDDLKVAYTYITPPSGSVSTTGQITYPGNDTVPGNNAATGTTTVTANAPTVMVTKTVDHTTHNAGDSVNWTLTVNNTGTSATTGVITLTDALPSGITNVVVTPSSGVTCSPANPTAGTTLTCSVPAGLAATNGTATVGISATLPTAGTYNNSVTPSGNATDNPTCAANACSTVTVVGSATMQVFKTSVDGTGTFSYALTNMSATTDSITTSNQNTSTPGVINVVTSLSTPITINESSSPAGFSLTSASCVDTNSAATGNTGSFGTLSGTTLTIPTANIKQNSTLQCTFVNTAAVSMSIAKTGPTAMTVGNASNYTVTVTNTSAAATVTTATVSDQLPAGFTFNSGSGNGWTCSAVAQLVTCNFSGTIAKNGTSVITISATPTAAATGVINYATVDPSGGTAPATASGCTASSTCALSPSATVTASGLTIAKSAPTPGLMPNANSVYTLTVTNTGTAAIAAQHVRDQLPSQLTFVSATGTNWTCTESGTTFLITCTSTTSLAGGASSTIAVTVKPTSQAVAGTSVTNYASIDPTGGNAPPTAGPSCSPSGSCASQTSTVGGPNVQVTKTVDSATHALGDTVTWTIKAANTGGTATTAAVTLTDNLPANISNIVAAPSSGTTCTPATPTAGGTLTCTVPAGLAATTGVATVTITATATATGSLTNTVSPSGTDNPTCAAGACSATTMVGGQSLTLVKALTGSRVANGDQFTVQISSGASVVASATTTGTGSTVGNASTGETMVTAGTAYTLNEVAAGSTTLSSYVSTLACTNATTGSTTTLPTTLGGTVTPAAGDRITCTITNSARPVVNLTKALGTARVHNTDQFTLQIANGGTVVGTATTSGTGAALSNNSTGATTLSAGTTYTLSEIAASGSGTQLAQYTSALSCANSNTGSATVLPTTLPGSLTPANGDNISCTLTNTAKQPVVTYLATLSGNRAANTDQFTLAIANGATTVDSVTTTGTGNTLTNNTTGAQTLVSGTSYTLTEAAAGTTNLAEYTSTLSCTNSDASSTTTLPTTLPATLMPSVGDNITCTVAIVPRAPTIALSKALGSNREAANDQFTLQINAGATTVASTTTTGSGNTVANGSINPTAVTSGTTYTLTEVASGGANLALYTKALSCTNSLAGSGTVLPTTVPGNVTAQDGDAISCTLTNTGNAELATTKTLLTVNGAAPGATVKPGDVLVYQLAVQNSGASSGTTTLGETVPTGTTYTGAGAEGWGGTCAAAGSTCTQAVTAAAGATVNKTFTVTLAAGASGASISNTATSSSGTCTTCSVTTPIAAELTTTKTLLTVNGAAPGATVKPGDVLVYQLAIQNTGGGSGTTTLGETVPTGSTYSGAAGEGWGGTCAAAGSTCSQAVTVAAATTVDKTFTVTIAAGASGNSIVNSATSSLGACPTCSVSTPLAAEISTTKTLLTVNGAAPGATVKPGDVLVYQLAVQNSGGASGSTTLGETVPVNTAYSGAAGEGWGGTCAAAGSTCTQTVTAAAGATVNKTFTVTVAAGASGASITNTATSSVGSCTTCSVTTPIAAELVATKTLLTVNGAAPGASVKAGDVLVYQLAVQNSGGSSGTTTLGETVPANTAYSGAAGEGWGGTCAAAGSTCSQAVTVAAGATVDKTFTVTVAAAATGASIVNTASSSTGSCTATCSVTTPLSAGALATTKTLLTVNGAAPTATVKPGDVLVYQLAVQNTGGSASTTSLGESVPAETTYSGAAGEGWGGTCAAAGSTCAQSVTVNAGATVDKTFTVTIAAAATGTSIVNTATSSAGSCTTCSVTTPIAAELVTTKTLLTVNGAAPGASVKPGDVLVYQLAVQNNGGSSGTTTLGETVPTGTAYSGAGAEGWGGTCAAAGSTCTQAVPAAAGATITKTFTVTVAAGATGASITNTATSSVGTCTSCSVTTPIAAELTTTKTLLSVNGAAPGASVKPGDVLVYQLAVHNSGGASGSTTLGETVPGNTAYSGAGAEGWGGTCAAAGSTCSQSVTAAAGATVNKTFTVTVAAGASGTSITNTATSSVGTCTAGCSVTTPLAGILATSKTLLSVNGAAPGGSLKAGDVLVYQIAVQNSGGSSATTTLGEAVPTNTTYSGAAGEGWGGSCAAAGSTCSQAATVATGATLDKTFTVTVSAAVAGASIVNTVTSTNGSCGAACTVTTPVAAATIATTKTLLTVNGAAPGASVKPGDVLVYQLAVQNTGGSSGTTTLGETVPAGTTYSGAGAEGWGGTCAAAGSTCSQLVSVTAGSAVNKTFTVTVAAGATGASITNTATSSTGTCASCSVTTPIAAELTTTKTLLTVNGAAPGASVKPGDVLVYQLAVQNTGGASGTTTLGETVPVNTTYSGAAGEGWGGTCAAAGSTCSQSVTLAAATSVNKTFTVTVAAGATGASITNTATTSVGTCTATCSVTTPIAAELVTTKTLLTVNGAAPGASVKPSDVLVYQLAVKNNGGASGTTTLGETVPIGSTYTGAGAEGWGGTCAAAGSTCSQAVTAAAGATVNKTFTVTVAAGASGASITNTATTSTGTCAATCSVTTPIAAELATTKTLLTVNGAAPGASVKPGDVLVYQLAVQNNGGSSGTTTLGETVPTGTAYSGAGAEGWGGTCAAAGSTCTQAVTAAAGATINKTFTVTVAAGASGASISNTATSSLGSCATCTVATPLAAELVTTKTLLTVNGAAPGASVKPGDVLVYQLAVQNNGGTSGSTTLGETVPVNTAYSGAAGEGWGGTCAAAGTTCSQAVTAAAGATVDKTFTVTVAAGASGTSITNTATSTVGACATCSVTTPIAAELATTKTLLTVNGAAPGASVKPGDVLVYQLAVHNSGGTSGNTTLGETVPAGTAYSGAAGEGWGGTCAAAGSTCSQAVTAAAGVTVNKTFTVTVAAGASGASITNTATTSIGSCTTCSVTTPIAAELTTTKTLLTVNGAAPTATVKPGDVLVYQFAVQNNGGASGTTTLGETVPANTSYTGAGAEGWGGTCAAAGSTCSQAVTAAAGATVNKTFTVTVAAGATGASIVNTASSSVGTCSAACSVTTPLVAELSTTKTLLTVNGAAPGASVKAGDVLVYQLAVQNNGGTTGTTTLGETVPLNTAYSGAAGEGWGGTCAAAGSTCSQAVTAAAGATVNKTFTVTVAAGVGAASITNTATSSIGSCASCSVTTPVAAGSLATTKTLLTVNGAAPGASVKEGDVLIYQLAVKNNGGSAATTSLGETVPANTAYSGAAGEGWGGTCTTAGSTCAQSVTANAGATINKTFTVTVAAGVAAPSITNTATSTVGSCTTCSVTTPVAAGVLNAVKTLLTINGAAASAGATVKGGDALVYQIALTNSGGSGATTTLGETVPAGTLYSGAAEGWGTGCAAAGSTCSQSVTLAGNTSINKTFTVTVLSPTGATTTITNVATSSVGTCSACTVNDPVAQADVETTLNFPTSALPNAAVSGTIVYSNLGPSTALGVTYTASLTPGLGTPTFTMPAGATASYNNTTGVVTFGGLPTTLASGANAGTITVNYVQPSSGSSTQVVAAVQTTTNDPVPGNNSRNATVAGTAEADLFSTLNVPTTVNAGSTVTGTVAWGNLGPSTASTPNYILTLSPGLGSVTFSNLPPGVTASYDQGSGNVTFGGTGLPTSLTSGQNVPAITFSYVQPASGSSSVTSNITSITNDPVPGNNAHTDPVGGVAEADTSATLNFPANVNAGSTVSGTLIYANNGPSPAANVTYGLTLASGLANVTFPNLPAGVTATYAPGTGVVTLTGLPTGLPSGTTEPTITVSYTQPAGGSSTVGASIASSTADPNTGNNNPSVTVNGNPEADSSVSLNFPANVAGLQPVSGTVTFANAGPSIANGETYTLMLTPGLAGVSFANLPTGVTASYAPGTGIVTLTGMPATLGVNASVGPITVNYTQPASGVSAVTATVASSTADPNTANNSATANVVGTAATADLAIQTSAPATVAPDGSLIYTLTITNNGPGAANNATFTDTLPSVLGVPTASCAPASGGVTCGTTSVSGKTVTGTLTSLPSGGTAVITITTTAPASGTFTDTATVAAPAGIVDPVTSNNSSSATTTVGAVPNNVDLSVTASGTTSVQPNGTVTYVVDVVNGGPAAANNAVFNYTTATPVTNVTWTCVAVGGGAVCPAASGTGNNINQTIANFPDGGHLEYTITGKAPAAPQQFVDTATITAPGGVTETNTANNTANTTTNVQSGAAPSADLATTINGPSTVQPGAPVVYSVVVTNNGPSAANGATLTVPVASQVTNVTTTCVATGGAVCPSVAAGNNINSVIPTLPNGGQLTFTITGTAPQSGTFDTSSTVTAPTGTNDPVPSNNTAGPVVTTVPNLTADLSIQKNGPAQVLANGIVNYTITVSNAGPNSADGAAITDNLPASLTNVTAVCSNASGGAACGAATVTGSTLNASAATLPAAGSITLTVSGKAPASGTLSNSASVSPPTGVTDPNPGNNTAGPVVTNIVASVPTQADLSATLTGPSTVAPNGLVTYQLTITNAGPAAGDGAPVTDVLPAVLTNPHATCGNALGGATCGPVTFNGNTLASTIAALPVGASLTFTITATAPASGTFTDSASVGAAPNTTDPNTANNVGGPVVTTIGAVTSTANLGISKTGPTMAGAGADFSYTIVVSNAGPGAANGALVSDPVPAGLSNIRASCGAPTNGAVCGPVLVNGQNVTSSITTLPALGTVTLTITVTAPVPTGLQPMSVVNRATVTPPSGVNDPDSSDNISGAVETSIVSAGVSGTVWLDLNHDRKDDAGDPPLPNWIVELFHNGVLVATTTTSAQGQYSFSGVPPGPGYSIDFRDPGSKAVYGTPTNGDQGVPNPDSDAVIGNGIIESLTLKPGINIVQQSLPVDPSGVIYDATSRTPIGGASVTLVGPPGFNPATQLVGGTGNVTQVTGGVGLTAGDYQFLLINPGGAGGAPAGTYSIVVTPPSGYLPPPAKGGGVEAPAGTFTVPGPLNATTAIQPNARPPKVGVNGPGTVYYFNLVFSAGSGSVINNHIPLDRISGGALTITKTGNTASADIGETVLYTVDVTSTIGTLPNVTVTDRLPRGFTYIAGTATLNGVKLADPKGAADGDMTFFLGTVVTGTTDELKYRVRVGVGAQQGDGVNRAQAQNPLGATSNVATFKVDVNGGVFTTDACVIGKVFVDCNGNQIQDAEELGIPGVRLYFSDGTFVVTDSEGKYSYCGLRPTTHTLKVDRSTMPLGSVLVESSNRNALDPNSLFIDLKNGEMHQADFIEGSCSSSVMEQVKARRGQGEVNASRPTEKVAPALIFDSKPISTPGSSIPPVSGSGVAK